MHEFDLIKRYFAPLSQAEDGALHLKDDAAVISPTAGCQTVYTKDLLLSDVHFFASDDPFTIAQKLWAVNLSDLAAMGATPKGYLLGLGLPKTTDAKWIERFAKGAELAIKHYGGALWGGDTTSHASESMIMLSLTAIGEVPDAKAVKRSSAQVGDDIYATGTIGDAYIGLNLVSKKLENADISQHHSDYLTKRYHVPSPRLEWNEILRTYAHAAIDISDGFVQDAGHIASCSTVQCDISLEKMIFSEAAQACLDRQLVSHAELLTGGDDYELLFTAPHSARAAIEAASSAMIAKAQRIGVVKAGQGVRILDAGQEISVGQAGYRHF